MQLIEEIDCNKKINTLIYFGYGGIFMYVIHAKRIYLILFCLLISTVFCQISLKKQDTVQTVALPINNKVIVLDAGHRTEKMEEQVVILE